MFNSLDQWIAQVQEKEPVAATDADWFDPNAQASQSVLYTAQQMENMWEAQQSSAAASAGDWGNAEDTEQQTYLTMLDGPYAPTLGWPGSTAATLVTMSTLVSSNVASVLSALEGYAVLDSACSHRSVFNDMRAFPNGVSDGSKVVMVDSNGKRKAAPGIGAAVVTSFPRSSSPIDVMFPEAVYNPSCPVNLICLSNIVKNKDGTKKDNDVSFKRLTIDLNIANAKTHRTIPIEELNGLFVIKIAFIAAVAGEYTE
jgi:hypothetical protein